MTMSLLRLELKSYYAMELNLDKAIFSDEVNDKPGHMFVARSSFDGHQSRGPLEP